MAKQKITIEESLEKKLWKAADKLRKNMDAAEYKHVALGLIFLKYISDAFEELYNKLKEGKGDYEGADPEDKNEYIAEKVFYVPPSARWTWLQGRAKLPTIGKDIDDAMDAIEKDNPSLKGVLPKVFAQEKLDKATVGGLVDMVSTATLGTKEAQSKDLLGRVFEYFLGEFALAEGKKGGQFYTPESVVKLLVEMLEPYEGRVFDPCCGSGGMFVQSEKFIKHHQDYYKKNNGKKLSLNPADHISIYGQESNQTTWRLAKMNLAIRGIDSSNVKWNNEGSFLNDAHKDVKADYIIANPPFNDSDWSGELLRKDARWVYGVPPSGNANYAWIQHFLFHLSNKGKAGFVLSNASLSSNTSGEGDLRKKLVEADLVDCIVMLPKELFLNTGIPACLWFIKKKREQRNKEILFIDASSIGYMLDKTNRGLSKDDITKVATTYHNWLSNSNYKDIKGFCKSITHNVISQEQFVLTPNIYVVHEIENSSSLSNEEIVTSINKVLVKNTIAREISDKNLGTNLKILFPKLKWEKLYFSSTDLLENLALSIFKSWFEEFNFNPAKAPKSKKELPEGWILEELQSVADITIGRTPPRLEEQWFSKNINDVKWMSIKDLGNCKVFIDKTSEYLTEEAVERFNVPIIQPNTVVVSFKLTVGRVAITTERMLSNEAIAHVNLKAEYPFPYFFYLLLKGYNYKKLGNTSSIGTAVNSKTIKQMKFVLPDKKTLKEFNSLISPLFERMLLNTHELKELNYMNNNMNENQISED
jgi:type I restriction enzyme M protein